MFTLPDILLLPPGVTGVYGGEMRLRCWLSRGSGWREGGYGAAGPSGESMTVTKSPMRGYFTRLLRWLLQLPVYRGKQRTLGHA